MVSKRINQLPEESVYHNRTLAVTEANALNGYFKFNVLKYSCLICGISFYNV
jgi:hypothetical protein